MFLNFECLVSFVSSDMRYKTKKKIRLPVIHTNKVCNFSAQEPNCSCEMKEWQNKCQFFLFLINDACCDTAKTNV